MYVEEHFASLQVRNNSSIAYARERRRYRFLKELNGLLERDEYITSREFILRVGWRGHSDFWRFLQKNPDLLKLFLKYRGLILKKNKKRKKGRGASR
jgi:hypothetical protein